jgi:hypothetical protein
LHEGVFGSAITLSVMADAINVICVVVQRPVRVMFEVIIISPLGQAFRRWYFVGHIIVRSGVRDHYIRDEPSYTGDAMPAAFGA